MKGPLTRLYWCRLPGLERGRRAQRHRPRHETSLDVRFAGPDQLVDLIGQGEAPLWGGVLVERLHRTIQIGQGITDRNQLAALTLHASFSHAPQTKQGHRARVPRAVTGRLIGAGTPDRAV